VIAAFYVVWQVGINDAEESVDSTFKAEGAGKKLLLNVGWYCHTRLCHITSHQKPVTHLHKET